jgi:hypothetical protein
MQHPGTAVCATSRVRCTRVAALLLVLVLLAADL